MTAFKAFLALIITGSFAHAGQHFRCRTDKVIEGTKPTIIQFELENLGLKSVNHTSLEDREPFRTVPRFSITDLNDNWTVEKVADGILMTSDGDGCQWTNFKLYANVGYRHGYIQVKDTGCGAKNAYSTVTCLVGKSNK